MTRRIPAAILALMAAPVWAESCLPDGFAAASSVAVSGPFACVTSDRFSDPLTLSQLLRNDLVQARSRGSENLIYARDEVRLGVQWRGWSLATLARQSATLVGNEGSVEVIRDIETPGAPPRSYQHHVDIQFSGFAGYGVALDSPYWRVLPGVSVQVGGQALSLARWMGRDILGDARFDADTGSYSLHAQSGYFNDRMHFPFQKPYAGQGLGVLFNSTMVWQVSQQGSLAVRAEDLGRLFWQRLPQDNMVLSTDTREVDADGYLVYKPLISGKYSQDGFSKPAVSIWTLAGRWQFDPQWALDVKGRRIDGAKTWLPYVGVSARTAGGLNWTAGWLAHEQAVSTSVSKGGLSLRLAADRLDGPAHARSMSLSWQGAW